MWRVLYYNRQLTQGSLGASAARRIRSLQTEIEEAIQGCVTAAVNDVRRLGNSDDTGGDGDGRGTKRSHEEIS